ncbi:uncharacterized protein LOC114519097 [Dendronephthya gigantea]|uniref:uncharacterized protein LOC114519097 n=1 Tax=Dendronephthya gigantea TaxID=151771 RepID=UPI00106B6450|nr:uncharacterized protein LOC114519097 [Dendronephthya gigantea]
MATGQAPLFVSTGSETNVDILYPSLNTDFLTEKRQKAAAERLSAFSSLFFYIILKPITLKLGKDRIATPKEKSHMPSKTQSHENPLRNFTQRKTEVILDENKVKNDGGLKLPDKVSGKVSEFKLETTTDTNSKMQEENNDNEDKIRKEGSGINTKGCTKRFLKETKMKGSMLKYKQNNPQIQVNNSALPTLNAAENRTSVKLSHTPERMDKIFHWIQRSSGKEREVAFNLLSTFSTSEKFQTKTAKKKERVKITLQVLERSKMPKSMEPMQLKTSKRDSTAMRLGHRESYNRLVKQREKEEMKTWHHVPLYHHSNTSNRSALFLQPSKRYQSHFSIHPDWGLHSQARFTKSIKT